MVLETESAMVSATGLEMVLVMVLVTELVMESVL
jgi:hypothetical protein